MLGLPAFGFADPGPVRDALTAAVLSGEKVATSSLVVDYVIEGDELSKVGQRFVVYDSAQQPVAVIETTAVRLATIGTVEDDFARAEGEGFADAAAWRVAHERFWNGHLAAYRSGLRDPAFTLSASTPIVCERFRLVAEIDPVTGTVAEPGNGSGDRLELDERAFLTAARTATLATTSPTGRPRLLPICFVVGADDRIGRARIYSPLDDKPKSVADPLRLARVRDLLARPGATLLVDRWSEDWTRLGWLRLEASADVLEPGTGEGALVLEALRAKYPQYERHRLEKRPILRFTVERAVAWGDLGSG
jgi:PPOX class probable F420-dependent enzyme